MKTKRYNCAAPIPVVKLIAMVLLAAWGCLAMNASSASADQSAASPNAQKSAATSGQSDPKAIAFLQQMLEFIGNGPAFDAKVRETVWASGREVVGVGTYEQSGGGSGQYNLQITMHDGDGKHRLQQISDGKLAWTRTEIAGEVRLRRVDVGRLEDWVRESIHQSELSPKLKIGAWGEMLSTLQQNYFVRMDTAKLRSEPSQNPEPMRVLIGDLKPERRAQVLRDADRTDWPFLYPTRMHVCVKATEDTKSGLGHWVPSRIEFWSDPVSTDNSDETTRPTRRLITLIELYSLRPIIPPAAERFRFENQDSEVNFVNETDRYLESYGVNLTRGQRRQLYR